MRQTKLDRIAEAYNGALNKMAMESAKARINYICDVVTGEKVLDIGCSQGIVPLLLARRGMDATGLDIEPGSIEYAEEQRRLEPPEVQERLRYCCDDFMLHDFEGESYDCIIITEVIEHLLEPSGFLKKAAGLLRPNGRIIASVPFGINPHPDHKRTYYFLDFYRLLCESFTPVSFEFVLRWLLITAGPKSEKENLLSVSEEQLLEKIEQGFSNVDSFKQERCDHLLKEKNDVLSKYDHLLKEKDDALRKCNDLLREKDDALSKYSRAIKKFEETREKNRTLQEEKRALRMKYEELNTKYHRLYEENARNKKILSTWLGKVAGFVMRGREKLREAGIWACLKSVLRRLLQRR